MKEVKRKFFQFYNNRKGIVTEYLPWLLLAVIILVILVIAIFVMKGEGESLIDKIKNIFAFR
jgi:Na+/melibiose symporter-like transporter